VKYWVGSDAAGRPLFKEGPNSRAPATVNRMKAALSALYKYAARKGYTTRNPARQVAAHPEQNKRIRFLSEEERAQLLLTCHQSTWPKLYLLVITAIMTGARKGELKSLRWEQIDFENRRAELPRTKNDQPRTLSFPRAVIEEMMRFRTPAGLLFESTDRPGRSFDEKKVWHRALADAGVTNFRFHDLRHSAASYLAMGGATLLEIADVLGHKNLQTTKRYAHLDAKHKQQVTDRILGGLA
jgi:integrase